MFWRRREVLEYGGPLDLDRADPALFVDEENVTLRHTVRIGGVVEQQVEYSGGARLGLMVMVLAGVVAGACLMTVTFPGGIAVDVVTVLFGLLLLRRRQRRDVEGRKS